MLISSSRFAFRFVHHALISCLFVLGVSAVGCTHEDREDACFDWPDDTGCPGVSVAVLYLGSAIPACAGELVSIDAPPVHRQGQCCYAITVESSDGCGAVL